jgi:cytochrome P450
MTQRHIPLPYQRAPGNPFDPVPELLRLRSHDALTQLTAPGGDPVWLITRYADARRVMADRRFSTARTPPTVTRPQATGEAAIASPTRQPGGLAGTDPPEHTRLRRMISSAFSPRRIARLRSILTESVHRRLDVIEQSDKPVDLVSAFAQPVASTAICELLGVPVDDREFFKTLAYRAFDRTLSRAESARVFTAMWDYNSALARRQRERPDDTVLGALARDHGRELTEAELTGLINGLLIAGQDTSSSMIGLGILLLLDNPAELATVRDKPESVEGAVEEMLRYLCVVRTGLVRTAIEDVQIGGQLIKAGEYIMMSLSVANRDPDVYPDPDRFDITRKIDNHLAFGHGTHFCLGATLARHELTTAIPAILRRFPTLRLAIPFDQIQCRPFSSINGLETLPVVW